MWSFFAHVEHNPKTWQNNWPPRYSHWSGKSGPSNKKAKLFSKGHIFLPAKTRQTYGGICSKEDNQLLQVSNGGRAYFNIGSVLYKNILNWIHHYNFRSILHRNGDLSGNKPIFSITLDIKNMFTSVSTSSSSHSTFQTQNIECRPTCGI